jgi:hypothetical protein
MEELANELEDDYDNDIVVLGWDNDERTVEFTCEARTFVLYKDGDIENGYDWHIKEVFRDYSEKGLNL